MLRILMAVLLTAMTSACTVGLPSAVDAIPFEARLTAPPFVDGDYCPLKENEDGAFVVKTQDPDGSGCATFTWDAARRLFKIRNGEGKTGELRLADMGDGLFLIQFPLDFRDDTSEPFSFLLMGGASHGAAIAILPLPSDEKVVVAAARHPGIVLSTYESAMPFTAEPIGSADGAEHAPATKPDLHFVSAGSPEDIRSLARDLTLSVLDETARQGVGKNVPPSRLLPILLLDRPSQADHAPSPDQQRDVEALAEKLLKQSP